MGGGGGGKGPAFNVIGLRYLKFLITTLLFIGVYNIILIIKYNKSRKNVKLFLEIMPSLLV